MCEMIEGLLVTGFEQMVLDRTGPTGWKSGADPIRRISAWTTVASDRRRHGVSFLNETVVRGTKSIINSSQSALYLHVGDGAFVAGCSKSSNSLMYESAVGLEDIGFKVGSKTEEQSYLKIVGYELERSPGRLRLPAFKTVLLYNVMRHLAS